MSMSMVNADTISVGASSTTNVFAGPARITVRTASTGVKVGGSDLDSLGCGFELLPDVEYTFELRPFDGNYPSNSNEKSLLVKNTNGSGTITLSYLAVALP